MDFSENTKLLLKEEVFQIVGAAIEVLNHIGHGFHEKPYENALTVEFGLRKLRFNSKSLLIYFTKPAGSVSSFLI
ncbi:MAG: GxxExxY protein [Limisphaerales bacterium]